ncbi:unnamed protein product [Mesocestoides corti]|uniref:LITAF domain-containing protein n=1 Tax=Mesocestoides corti TaxID=53468 RepID=A0A0R3UJ05_MESCO|nr:unnamed protein product [Mesocestoides corti]
MEKFYAMALLMMLNCSFFVNMNDMLRSQLKRGILMTRCCIFCFRGCFGCCFIPLCVDYFKDAVHTCPYCGAILGTKSRC